MASYAPRTLEKPPLVPLSPLVEFEEAAIATAAALADDAGDGCRRAFQMAERGIGPAGPRACERAGVNDRVPPVFQESSCCLQQSNSGVGGVRACAPARLPALRGAPPEVQSLDIRDLLQL